MSDKKENKDGRVKKRIEIFKVSDARTQYKIIKLRLN